MRKPLLTNLAAGSRLAECRRSVERISTHVPCLPRHPGFPWGWRGGRYRIWEGYGEKRKKDGKKYLGMQKIKNWMV